MLVLNGVHYRGVPLYIPLHSLSASPISLLQHQVLTRFQSKRLRFLPFHSLFPSLFNLPSPPLSSLIPLKLGHISSFSVGPQEFKGLWKDDQCQTLPVRSSMCAANNPIQLVEWNELNHLAFRVFWWSLHVNVACFQFCLLLLV